MSSRDLISMGIRNLWRRKARSILTILGVVIGTAAIVVMMSLGIGIQKSFEQSLDGMGSINIIEVHPMWDYDDMEKGSSPKVKGVLNDKAVENFEKLENVTAVMPYLSLYVELISGKYMADVNITGIDMEKAEQFDFKIDQGSMPTGAKKNEIIMGSSVPEQFYDSKSRRRGRHRGGGEANIDVLTAPIKMIVQEERNGDKKPRGRKVNVVGILAGEDGRKSWQAYMDIEIIEKIKKDIAKKNKSNAQDRRRNKNKNKYETIEVKVEDIKKVQEVQQKIKDMGFEAWSLADMLEEMKKVSSGIQAVLGGIGAVSLFVAALGITNTMIMSIYERTKEIGVMKVLGAHIKDIKRLFLFEAGLIGLIGGLIGVALSYGISSLINKVGGGLFDMGMDTSISVIPIWLVVSALLFSTMMGVISGYYPARRAMKLSALEAIRTNS